MRNLQQQKGRVIVALSLILIVTLAVSLTACSTSDPSPEVADLMEGISSKTVSKKDLDSKFIRNTADFSVELFKKSITEKENSLISPLSAMLALAMTANGADKETLSQMETLLGGEIPLGELNEYLYTYINSLPSGNKSKLTIANSIWFREGKDKLTMEKDFLQRNADYYSADIYKSPFDAQTIKDINSWVNTNTDGMIEKILDSIDDNTIMYLINAIVFDSQWEKVYNKEDIFEDAFTTREGNTQTVEFMHSEETTYLDDGKAIGFIKPYANGNYSYVALLPNEDISIEDYVEALSGERFLDTIKGAKDTVVSATLPKFSYEYQIQMNDALKALGMSNSFSADDADFGRIGESTIGNIYIGEVIHKTFISVDELGTKAGAVTKVEMSATAVRDTKYVVLDRPFIYAIIDNSTNLPVFIGTVMSVD